MIKINPTAEEVQTSLKKMIVRANGRNRSRLVSTCMPVKFDGKEGVVQVGGKGVPNSYKYRATSTAAGYCWFTDHRNRVHVRWTADRVDAPKGNYGNNRTGIFCSQAALESGKQSIAGLVYKELSLAHLKKGDLKQRKTVEPLLIMELWEDGANVGAWMALSDWYEENPDMIPLVSREQVKKALAILMD